MRDQRLVSTAAVMLMADPSSYKSTLLMNGAEIDGSVPFPSWPVYWFIFGCLATACRLAQNSSAAVRFKYASLNNPRDSKRSPVSEAAMARNDAISHPHWCWLRALFLDP